MTFMASGGQFVDLEDDFLVEDAVVADYPGRSAVPLEMYLPTLSTVSTTDFLSTSSGSSDENFDPEPESPFPQPTPACRTLRPIMASASAPSALTDSASSVVARGAVLSSAATNSLVMEGLQVYTKKKSLSFTDIEKRATKNGNKNLLQVIKWAKTTLKNGVPPESSSSVVMEGALSVLTAVKQSFSFRKSEPQPPGQNDANMKLKRSLRQLFAMFMTGSTNPAPAAARAIASTSTSTITAGVAASASTVASIIASGLTNRPEISIVKFRDRLGIPKDKGPNSPGLSAETKPKVSEVGGGYLKKFRAGEYSLNFDVTPKQTEPVNEDIVKGFGLLMNSWQTLLHQDQHYRDLVRERLRAKLHSGDYVVDAKGNGVDLWMRHKPMEIISDMLCSMLLELIAGDLGESVEMAMRLTKVLRDPEIYQRKKFLKVYHYLESLLRDFVGTMFITEGARPRGSSFEDVDWSSHLQLKNNLSLLSWLMEHTLKRPKDWTLIGFPDASEIFDVEWLIEFAGVLRDRRLAGPFPCRVSRKEKEYVSKAMAMEPENPFVILSLLHVISGKKKLLTQNFETACRNLVQRFPQSAYIHLRVAKFYLIKGRNQKIAIEHLRRAITINPTHSEVNLLCAKYVCGKTRKVELGVKYREAFFRLAMTTDPSSAEAAVAYFSHALGTRKTLLAGYSEPSLFDNATANQANLVSPDSDSGGSSLHPTSATLSGMMTHYGERYNLSVEIILATSHALAWPAEVRSKILLFSALNFYVVSEFGGALELLLQIYKNNTVIAIIKNMDFYREKYSWDTRLKFTAFRSWLVVEYEDILEMELEERAELRQQRVAEGTIEDSDVDEEEVEVEEDMNGNNEDEDDPIKKMLIDLLQVL